MQLATCTAPTNIATIKYWGKENIKLNTPLNSSVSVTLHQNELFTKTTIAASSEFVQNELWLNGTQQALNQRVLTVLGEMKRMAQEQHPNSKVHTWCVKIVSINSFPTAAGLASSAAGYACLVATLAALYHVVDTFPGQLSTIARQGSGSACRSLYGGLVRWEKGKELDGSDSRAIPIVDEHHWPELRAVICVVNDQEKDTSSTNGMQNSKETSPFLAYRAAHIVSDRVAAMEAAYKAKDFPAFGQLMMQDSNQFHAVCMDTYPPIFYLNDTSRKLIHMVHKVNQVYGKICAAYTFDAGPNAVLFVDGQETLEIIVSFVLQQFPTSVGEMPIITSISPFQKGEQHPSSISNDLHNATQNLHPTINGVKQLYITKVGSGPMIVSDPAKALIDEETGMPRL